MPKIIKWTPETRRNQLFKVLSRCAPFAAQEAMAALRDFPSRSPLIEPCWPWRGGGLGAKPFCRVGDQPPGHPMTHFFSSGYKRLCQSGQCVNPHHFIARPRQEKPIRHPLTLEAEGDLEDMRPPPKNLVEALGRLSGEHFPADVILAYRNLREDGFLKPPRTR